MDEFVGLLRPCVGELGNRRSRSLTFEARLIDFVHLSLPFLDWGQDARLAHQLNSLEAGVTASSMVVFEAACFFCWFGN